jgi:hypothetical protein
MQEVSQNELKLIADNQFIKTELLTATTELSRYKHMLLIVAASLYVVITITATAIFTSNNQDKLIAQQNQTIIQLTAKVIEQQVILSEVEELLRIREDLSKVLP